MPTNSLSFVFIDPGTHDTDAAKYQRRVGIHSHAQKVTQQRKRDKQFREVNTGGLKKIHATKTTSGSTRLSSGDGTLSQANIAGSKLAVRNPARARALAYAFGYPTPSPEPEPICRPISQFSSWTEQQLRGVDVFRRLTIQNINPMFTNMQFWNDVVPALAQGWACVRDLVAAVACASQAIETRDESLIRTALALERAAIRVLQGDLMKMPLSAQVTCCVLFDALNVLRCDFQQAGQQLQVAKRLTSTVQMKDCLNDEMLPVVCDTLSKMSDTSAWTIWNPDRFLAYEKLGHVESTLELDLISTAAGDGTLEHLMNVMQNITRRFSGRTRRNLAETACIDSTSSLAEDVLNEFLVWKKTFDKYRQNSATYEDEETMRLMEIGYNFTYVTFVCGVLSYGELAYDTFEPQFQHVVNLSVEQFEDYSHRPRGVTAIKPFLQIVIPTLWLVIIFCRNPHIRREAISTLCQHHYPEADFDSQLTGQLARHIVEIEERKLYVQQAWDIPDANRIRIEGIQYCSGPRPQIILRYSMASDTSESAVRYEKHIDWQSPSAGEDMKLKAAVNALAQTCALYRKVLPHHATNGYIKPIVYENSIVDVRLKPG